MVATTIKLYSVNCGDQCHLGILLLQCTRVGGGGGWLVDIRLSTSISSCVSEEVARPNTLTTINSTKEHQS